MPEPQHDRRVGGLNPRLLVKGLLVMVSLGRGGAGG